jgi:tRNA(Ile)-lysidine synthase
MLIFDRTETRSYCGENGLPFHDDPANTDETFSRVRIRQRVLPELLLINPAVDDAITRMAELVAAEDRFLNGVAAAALETAVVPLNGNLEFLTADLEVAFDRSKIQSLPEVVRRRAVRLAVETLGGRLDSRETIAFEEGLQARPSGSVTAEGGRVAVEWSPERIHVRDIAKQPAFRHHLEFPGETISDRMGWKLSAWQCEWSGHPPIRTSLSVELDPASIRGRLYFRSCQANDRMQPLGFEHHRKLSDIMAEARLTQAVRERLPIVCDLLGPIWVPGVCVDERARPEEGSDKLWALRFEPAQANDRP